MNPLLAITRAEIVCLIELILIIGLVCLVLSVRNAPNQLPESPAPLPPPDHDNLTPAEMHVLLDTYRRTNVSLTTQLGAEQERYDKLRSLFERYVKLDELSQAARPHEQRAIEAEFQILCPDEPTRRSEP